MIQDASANDLASNEGDALRASYMGVVREQRPRTCPEGRERMARCRRRLHAPSSFLLGPSLLGANARIHAGVYWHLALFRASESAFHTQQA
jgi:hypothetical protein